MEDAMVVAGRFRERGDEDLFGIFDGHGGSRAAIRASNSIGDALEAALTATSDDARAALVQAFGVVHEKIVADLECGTTALVAYVRGNSLFIASTGDCRAIALSRDGTWRRVTRDHRPTDPDEAAAVKARGGRILRGRVGATLGFTRCLGDRDMAKFLSHEPDVFELAAAELDMLVLACDGVFDFLSDEAVVRVARSTRHADKAAKRIRDAALVAQSPDNISVMVVAVAPPPQSATAATTADVGKQQQ
jgi:serine/threonine protein phosphatase PrpC